MTHFNSAKDCLFHYGLNDKIGRGRISASNHAFLAEKIASGDSIAGYESVESSKTTGEKVFRNAHAPVSSEKIIADIGPATRDETELKAYVFDGGEKNYTLGMRDICHQCGNSFTYCHCRTPQRLVDDNRLAPVYFERRTTPFKRGW